MATKQTHSLPHLKTLNPAAPDALCEVIMQAVELNPDDRFATAQDLSTALKQATRGKFIGDRRSRDREVSRRNLKRNLAFAGCAAALASAGVYLLMPSVEEELVKAMRQPENVREFLSQEESREVLISHAPDLLKTAVETDDKELRSLLADLAINMITPEVETADNSPDRRRAEFLQDIQGLKDAFVEQGVNSPLFEEEVIKARKEKAFAGFSVRDRIERMRSEISASTMPESWKTNAQKQITRYLAAENNGTLFEREKMRIEAMLTFLLDLDNQGHSELSPDSLQHFIAFLKKELDRANDPHAELPNVPHAVEIPSVEETKHSTNTVRSLINSPVGQVDSKQMAQQLDGLLQKLQQDPKVSELIDKVTKDPRFSEVLERTREASGK